MGDRVHPKDSSPVIQATSIPQESSPNQNQNQNPNPNPNPNPAEEKSHVLEKPSIPYSSKPIPPPGTYVVQIPKDQIYRYPPPENPRRYQNMHSRHRRASCCCCLSWILGLLFTLIVLIAVATGVFYLVFRPQAPKYSVEKLSIRGFNLTNGVSSFSPEFDVTVRAENPNKKIGIYYTKGSSVSVFHSNDRLCDGVIPAFYQPTKNVTVFQTVLISNGIVLTPTDLVALRDEQIKSKIPLRLQLKVPVKIKVGSVKTSKITVKVNCDLTVDKLDRDASIVSKKCDVDVEPWH